MDHLTNQIESSKPSLLMLNDHCLKEISKFLNFVDYINLAKTCSRLRAIANKYKNIFVMRTIRTVSTRMRTIDHEERKWASRREKRNLLNFFSAVGEHVISVAVHGTDLSFLEILADKCKNLSTVDVDRIEGPLPFQNLKELKLGPNVIITTKELKRCFKKNPDLESLVFNGTCDRNFIGLLKMLPKLKSLKIKDVLRSQRLNQELLDLLNAKEITAFSFRSDINRNQFLIELGKQVNLLELKVYMPCDADTFDILKSFQNLEMLSMNLDAGLVRVLETKDLPLMLKYVKFKNINISCSRFLAFVKQTKFLKEVDIGSRGHIHLDNDESKFFPRLYFYDPGKVNFMVLSIIANELQLHGRTLKLRVSRYLRDRSLLSTLKFTNVKIIIYHYETQFEHKFITDE